jgi:hypothetical protein
VVDPSCRPSKVGHKADYVEGEYYCRFAVFGDAFGIDAATADPEGGDGYINYSPPGGGPASAGGDLTFDGHRDGGWGGFSIHDPTGAYIDSGGTASTAGVRADANIFYGGYDYASNTFFFYSLNFTTKPIPEPSSLLLVAIGVPGLLVWEQRRRAGRCD